MYLFYFFNFHSKILDDHRKTCALEGRYVGKLIIIYLKQSLEAEMAKNRIVELKHKNYSNIVDNLLVSQQQEKEEVERAHFAEYQDFNNKWDEQMSQFQQ